MGPISARFTSALRMVICDRAGPFCTMLAGPARLFGSKGLPSGGDRPDWVSPISRLRGNLRAPGPDPNRDSVPGLNYCVGEGFGPFDRLSGNPARYPQKLASVLRRQHGSSIRTISCPGT